MSLDEHLQEQVLLDYLLGELASPETRSAAEHLKLCASCRRSLQELEFEQQELMEIINGDPFPSAGRVSDARKNLTQWIDSYEWERTTSRGRRHFFSSLGFLATAASVLICLGFLWLRMRSDSREPDLQQVLAQVRLAEQSKPGSVLFRSYEVEISELKPVKVARLSRLESWSDSTTQRFSSRWLDAQGTLRHAAWHPSSADEVFTYDAAIPTRVAKRPQARAVSLWDLGESGLRCDDLAAAFVRWLETRSWSEVTLADGILSLTDQEGIKLDLKREKTGAQEVIRLSARRQTRRRAVEMVLVLEARTYQPQSLALRFQSAERVSELTIRRQEFREVSFAALDPAIFEPKLPSLRMDISSKGSERESVGKAPEPAAPLSAARDSDRNAVEVRIWFALHQAGACLGQPVRIEERLKTELVVTGIVPSGQMKDRILAELQKAELPAWIGQEIRTSVEAYAEQPSQTQGSEPEAAPPSEQRLPMEKELSAYFSVHPLPSAMPQAAQVKAPGVAEKIELFTNEAVNLADNALDEAWALRRLAERFGEGGKLHAASEALVQRMVQDHLSALRKDEDGFRQWLIPVLKGLSESEGPTSDIGVERPAHTWQGACLQLFRTAERAHEELMSLFAVNFQQGSASSTGTTKTAQALGRLLHFLEGIRGSIETASDEARQIRESGIASSVKSLRQTPVP